MSKIGEADLVNMRNDGPRVHMRRITEAMAKREREVAAHETAVV